MGQSKGIERATSWIGKDGEDEDDEAEKDAHIFWRSEYCFLGKKRESKYLLVMPFTIPFAIIRNARTSAADSGYAHKAKHV